MTDAGERAVPGRFPEALSGYLEIPHSQRQMLVWCPSIGLYVRFGLASLIPCLGHPQPGPLKPWLEGDPIARARACACVRVISRGFSRTSLDIFFSILFSNTSLESVILCCLSIVCDLLYYIL